MANDSSIKDQLAAIQSALKGFENGASIEELKGAANLAIGLRTFQRRLEKLREEGAISVSGDTRATRYYLVPKTTISPHGHHESQTQLVPLSGPARNILSNVTRPEGLRLPVSYNREFLESYRPNTDSYLLMEEKKRLARLGNTARDNQPAGTYAREILNRLLIDLSWNSSRLEGNTYSLLDTERLIALGETADNKSAMEAQMILNHKDAIEFLVQSSDEIGFNRYTILNLHALLSHNLLSDPTATGRLRQFAVGINRSVYTPLGLPQQIEEMFALMLDKASQIDDPFEQAFFIMVQLPYLQPFDDVNKRVSRLAANIPLNCLNLAPLSFIDVSNDVYIQGMLGVYELNKVELLKDVFIWAYERSCLRYAALRQSLGEPDPFRLKYRNNIRDLITEIVAKNLNRGKAAIRIKQDAAKLLSTDQGKFIDAVETELMALHEGNFARYWIRPAEFKAWREAWGR